jgi:hypothetical protein
MPVANLLAMALGFVVAAIGVLGLAAPSVLFEFGRTLQSPSVLYVVAAVRIAFGAILLCAAADSRTPRTLRILGILIVIAGVVTPFLGRTGAAFDWWSTYGSFARAWPLAAVGLGLFLAYTSSPRGST